MLGVLLKDVYNLNRQLKIYMLFPLLAAFLGFQNGDFQLVSMTLSFLSMFVVLSACAYDEQANFDSYALTLPLTRKDLVLSKYLLSFIAIIVNAVISIGTCAILNMFFASRFTNSNWQELIITVVVISLVINLILCILLPLIFKYGSEKARILLMVIFLAFGAMIYFFASADMTWVTNTLVPFLEDWGIYAIAGVVLIGEVISIVISNMVYARKEF